MKGQELAKVKSAATTPPSGGGVTMTHWLQVMVRSNPKASAAIIIAGVAIVGGGLYVARHSQNFSFRFGRFFGMNKSTQDTGASVAHAKAKDDIDATHVGERARADASHAESKEGSVSATAVDKDVPIEKLDAVSRLKGSRRHP